MPQDRHPIRDTTWLRRDLDQLGIVEAVVAALLRQQLATMRAAQAEFETHQRELREVAAAIEAAKAAEVERTAAVLAAAAEGYCPPVP